MLRAPRSSAIHARRCRDDCADRLQLDFRRLVPVQRLAARQHQPQAGGRRRQAEKANPIESHVGLRRIGPYAQALTPPPSLWRTDSRGAAQIFVGMDAGRMVFDEVPAMLTDIVACPLRHRYSPPRSRARSSNSVLEIQPNNVMALFEKRLALVGEESVSGSPAAPPPGQSGAPTHAHLHYRQ